MSRNEAAQADPASEGESNNILLIARAKADTRPGKWLAATNVITHRSNTNMDEAHWNSGWRTMSTSRLSRSISGFSLPPSEGV